MSSSAASWRNRLSKTIIDLVFSLSLVDPDIWIHAATKAYVYRYWEYILLHYDYLLVIYHQANIVMKGFNTEYTLNPEANNKNGPSQRRIGADIAKFQVPDTGETSWSMSGDTYIKEEIKNVELELDK